VADPATGARLQRLSAFCARRRLFRPAIGAFLGVLRCVMARSMLVSLVQCTARRKANTSEFN
jgi:hypothetical protein